MTLDYTSNSAGLPFTQQIHRDFSPELQWTEDYQICIVLTGSITIHRDAHERALNVHDIFFIQPFNTYSIQCTDNSSSILVLTIDRTYVASLCPDISMLAFKQQHVTYDLSNPIYTKLCSLFAVIIFNNLKNEVCTKLKLMESINSILILFFESYSYKTNEPKKLDYNADRTSKIIYYLNNHYSEKLTVSDIASFLGLHPQYFSSIFAKIFQTTFVDYLTTLRVNRSINDLTNTSKTMLEIALDNGFTNHKTYSSAFKKVYDMLPTDYRKSHRAVPDQHNPLLTIEEDNDIGVFSFFRQFYINASANSDSTKASLKAPTMLHLNPESSKAFHDDSIRLISVGRAYSCLRYEIQEQLRQAKHDLKFDHVRIRDIFSDDLYVYYENHKKQATFSWQSLDAVFDFIYSLGAKPFPEIGFMPEQLASKKQYAGWQYHPNVSYPKSMANWKVLIKSFLTHFIDRYGLSEVRSWHFDFWTNPDLKIKNPYWNESQESFFEFYKETYKAFKEVDSELQLGTPTFSTLSDGYDWYDAFFKYCFEHKLYPSNVSVHLYGSQLRRSGDYLPSHHGIEGDDFISINPNRIIECVQKLQIIMNRNGFRSLDIIISDWNISFTPSDLVRDTCYMGPYIVHNHKHFLTNVKGACFWSLSDIHEDFFPQSGHFHGGPGLLEYHGLKKASYNTYALIDKLGDKILKIGENYIFAQTSDAYQLLIYNLAELDNAYEVLCQSALDEKYRYTIYNNEASLSLGVVLSLPAGTYYTKKYEVNRSYGSAFDIWSEMGYPESLSKDMEDYLRESSSPHISYTVEEVTNNLMLDVNVPPHGVILIEISQK